MGVIDRFADRLPVGPNTPRLTLGEGSTPLVKAARLGEKLGVELYFKFEGMNPTGSFKDRGMCVAVAKAVEDGFEGIVCASTGNTAASAAAYGARAGLTAVVLTPQGAIAAAKSAQSRAVAAKVAEVNGSFDDALKVCLELAERGVLMLVNSLNPHRIEGQKTAAFEICEELGRAPDVLALPYGGGGNSVAYAKGFSEEGASTRMVSVQAAERATTLASAIRIAEPAHIDEVDGLIANGRVQLVTVDDSEITAAWLEIASNEGLFCEPSSAAGYAGLARVELEPGSTVVAVLTGHGLKDTAAVDVLAEPTIVVQPNVESILAGSGAVNELRASDAERDETVAQLRESVADGRLTLEEFTERMETAYESKTHAELDALTRDLPAKAMPAAAPSRRSPTRFVLSLFGSSERDGRIRIGRRVTCLAFCGNVDLDLREATLDADVVTIVAVGVMGAIDVYVPEGIEVDLHGLALLGHKGERGADPPAHPGTPLVRVHAFSLMAGIDVWRVPLAWMKRSIGDVIEGIETGKHKELSA